MFNRGSNKSKVSKKEIPSLKIYTEGDKKYLYFGKYINEVVHKKSLIKKIKQIKPNNKIYKYNGEVYIKLQSTVNKAGTLLDDIDIVMKNGKLEVKTISNQVFFRMEKN